MRRLKTLGSALLVAAVLVVCADYTTYAATGSGLILGHSNSASKMTTVSRTKAGPVLNLHAKRPAYAPLATNGRGRVANLNADLVDGWDSSQMVNKTLIFSQAVSTTGTGGFTVTLHSVPAGYYQATANAWLYGPTTGGLECGLTVASTGATIYEWFTSDPNGYFTPHQVGVLKVPTAGNLTYFCSGGTSNYHTYSGQPLQIALSPIASLVHSTASQNRVANARIAVKDPRR